MPMSTLHLEGARSDTPGCAHVMHFNNAGSSLPPRPVVQAQIDHLTLEATIGGYEAAEQNHEQIEHTYTALAKLIGAQPSEIAFVENATRAWDAAFYSIDNAKLNARDSSAVSHSSQRMAALDGRPCSGFAADMQLNIIVRDASFATHALSNPTLLPC